MLNRVLTRAIDLAGDYISEPLLHRGIILSFYKFAQKCGYDIGLLKNVDLDIAEALHFETSIAIFEGRGESCKFASVVDESLFS